MTAANRPPVVALTELDHVSPIDWASFRPERVDEDLLYMVRTTCLLESRSAMYGEYLLRVLPARFGSEVATWAEEELHHGRALRRWLALSDPTFDFDAAFNRYCELPYHEGESTPRRGGVAHELLSRCVVEALASGYYFALGDRSTEPLLKQICARLMADERRHLEMFGAMLSSTPRLGRRQQLGVVVGRVRELNDDQILFAAHCANHLGRFHGRSVQQTHLHHVYSMHRKHHLAYICDLVSVVLGWPVPPSARQSLAAAGVAALRVRTALGCVKAAFRDVFGRYRITLTEWGESTTGCGSCGPV